MPKRTEASVIPEIYQTLRTLAAAQLRKERRNHTLRPTELVHMAYLKLAGQPVMKSLNQQDAMRMMTWAMKNILIDYANRRNALKRAGSATFVQLIDVDPSDKSSTIDILVLADLLEHLRRIHCRQADVVELRLIGGYPVEAIATVLGVSTRTVIGDYKVASAWMRREWSR